MSTTYSSLNLGGPLTAAPSQSPSDAGQGATPPMSRLGSWLRRRGASGASTAAAAPSTEDNVIADDETGSDTPSDAVYRTLGRKAPLPPLSSRAAILARGKRSAGLRQLQKSVAALADLMTEVRHDLGRQAERHDGLLRYLSHLPRVVQQFPESARMHGEAIKAIHQQMERQASQHAAQQASVIEQRAIDAAQYAQQAAEQADRQAEQQARLASVLEGLTAADTQRGQAVERLEQQVVTLSRQEQAVAESLGRFGEEVVKFGENLTTLTAAVQTACDTSQATARVLEQIREDLARREAELEKAFRRHNTRFTSMLAVAISMSVAAVGSVVAMAYLVLDRLP